MAELLLVNPAHRAKRKTNPKVKRKPARKRNPISQSDAAYYAGLAQGMKKAGISVAGVRKSVKTAAKGKRKATVKKGKKGARRRVAHNVRLTNKNFTKTEARKYGSKSERVKRAMRVMQKRRAAKRLYGINPLNLGQLQNLAVPALAGALSGFVINTAFDKIEDQTWYPDVLKNEYGKAAAKAALAIGASMALSKVKMVSPANRNAALGGALVIIAYDLLEGTLFPKVKEALGMDGYQLAGYQDVAGLGEFEYVDPADEGDMAGLGYINSAPVVGFEPAERTYTA